MAYRHAAQRTFRSPLLNIGSVQCSLAPYIHQETFAYSSIIRPTAAVAHRHPCKSPLRSGRGESHIKPSFVIPGVPIAQRILHARDLATSISIFSSASTTPRKHELDNEPDMRNESPRLNPTSYEAESSMYPTWDDNVDVAIDRIEVNSAGDILEVTWRESSGCSVPAQSFPLVWLRDNCRCESCFNPSAKSRSVPMQGLVVNSCGIENMAPSDDAKSIIIHWTDGHVSQYPAQWLRCNAFSDSEPDPTVDLEPHLWDAATCRDHFRAFDFNDLLRDDHALYEFLREIKILGITVIENAPLEFRQLHRLAERVGYLLPCNYGETFRVESKTDASNAAYTSGDLPLHTDLSYYINTPSIQLLHCIKQAEGEGGDNTLVDGFKVAYDLRETHPDLYDILTKEMVEFYDVGVDAVGDFYQHSRHTIIRLNHQGKVNRIVFSDHGRSAMSRLPVKEVVIMYRALLSYAAKLYDPVNVYEYKMKDGDILAMDNHRVLHGRKAYTMKPGSYRLLEGGYLEWDTVMSKLRVLRNALGAN